MLRSIYSRSFHSISWTPGHRYAGPRMAPAFARHSRPDLRWGQAPAEIKFYVFSFVFSGVAFRSSGRFQSLLVYCWARVKVNAPGGASFEILEPAPTVAFSPI